MSGWVRRSQYDIRCQSACPSGLWFRTKSMASLQPYSTMRLVLPVTRALCCFNLQTLAGVTHLPDASGCTACLGNFSTHKLFDWLTMTASLGGSLDSHGFAGLVPVSENLEFVKTLLGAMIHVGVGGKLAAFRNLERYQGAAPEKVTLCLSQQGFVLFNVVAHRHTHTKHKMVLSRYVLK
ncbi:hypothetical protein V8C40DRAFT_245789 [Trichoderma camerunense]